jgi:parallel beta-helix repeat protein
MNTSQTGFTLGLLLAHTLVFPVLAGEGRRPLFERTVITEAGKYIVTRDIPQGPGVAIEVASGVDHVDIDLNGFTVYGNPVGGPGANTIAANTEGSSVAIHSGHINALGGSGIYVRAKHTIVEDIRITGGGITIIAVSPTSSFVVRRNLVQGESGNCLFVWGLNPEQTYTGSIESNVVVDCGNNGFKIESGGSVSVRNNRIKTCGADGISIIGCDGCLFTDNTIEDCISDGIIAEAVRGSTFRGNVIRNIGRNGIILDGIPGGADDNLILNNVVSSSANRGMWIIGGSRNQIDRNLISGSGEFGILFSGSGAIGPNTYGRNTVIGNAGGIGTCSSSVCDPAQVCDDDGNVSFGDNIAPGPDPC